MTWNVNVVPLTWISNDAHEGNIESENHNDMKQKMKMNTDIL